MSELSCYGQWVWLLCHNHTHWSLHFQLPSDVPGAGFDGENFDEECAGEEARDGYCSGNEQLTGSDFSDSSGEGSSENSDDDYEPIAKRWKGTAATTSRSSKNSHSNVDRSQCEPSAGSEGEDSESDEHAVAKSQPRQNAVSNAYSGRDGTL